MFRILKLIGTAFAAFVAGSLYLWYGSVRNLPAVKRRKAARRAARRLARVASHQSGARPGEQRLGQPE